MAKGLTKTALIRTLAEQSELPTKKVGQFFELMSATAVKETKKNGEFTIPGIGKLVKAERKARTGRNPQREVPHREGRQGCHCSRKELGSFGFKAAKAAADAAAFVSFGALIV